MALNMENVTAVPIEPTCRYGHGPLTVLDYNDGKKTWVILSVSPNVNFTGHMFLCETCGYTEFFDNEVVKTRRELRGEE